MITNAKNCVDLGRKVTLRKNDKWWRYRELIDSKYWTICNALPNWKNLNRLSRDLGNEDGGYHRFRIYGFTR